MSQEENTASFIEASKDKENISKIQNKSNLAKDSKSNIILKDATKIESISLENKFPLEQNNKNLISNNFKYGIDESGNPINIKEYYKSINDSVNINSNTSIYSGITSITQKLKKPIAYITKDENNNNILVDLNGNKITTKNKDGDYDFHFQLHVIIKDFDVKHPELRVNGERYYKSNNMLDDIEIRKEIEKDTTEVNKSSNSINRIENYKNKNIGRLRSPSFSSSIRNHIGNLIDRVKMDINKENIYYTKYKKSLLERNNNKVVVRTSGILNSSNSQAQDYFKNNSRIKKNNDKQLFKNKSFMECVLRNKANLSDIRYNRNLKEENKADKNINNLKCNLKSIKSSLLINNINSNFKRKKYGKRNNGGISHRNKNGILFTDANTNKTQINYIYQKSNKFGRNNNIMQLNKNNDIFKFITTEKLGNNNINKISTRNYFIIKHHKSYTNNTKKIIKNDNEGKDNLLKKINKKSIFIPINSQRKIINNKSNFIFDLNKKIQNNSNNFILNKIKIKKKNYFKNQDLSQRIGKIDVPKLEKLLKINNGSSKYYILSEEANNMITSYSKRKSHKDSLLSKKNESTESKKNSDFKYKKIHMISNGNNSNINNSYYSNMNKNGIKENSPKQSLYKKNRKYVGITLSLRNNENNKNKKTKTIKNNQININFTPCQIQCESLIKNNNSNNQENINSSNIIDKKFLDNLKTQRILNNKNYELCF